MVISTLAYAAYTFSLAMTTILLKFDIISKSSIFALVLILAFISGPGPSFLLVA
jgi:hypothetical protein